MTNTPEPSAGEQSAKNAHCSSDEAIKKIQLAKGICGRDLLDDDGGPTTLTAYGWELVFDALDAAETALSASPAPSQSGLVEKALRDASEQIKPTTDKPHGGPCCCGECSTWHSYEIVKGMADQAALRTNDQTASSQSGLVEAIAESVKQQVDDGEGFWHICSGCTGTDNPRSDMLGCEVGMGCSECGGLGAIWDDTDYAGLAHVPNEAIKPSTNDQTAPDDLTDEQWEQAKALAPKPDGPLTPITEDGFKTAPDAGLVGDIITDVCELPDYQSPDDQPDLLQCTVEELTIILERHITALSRNDGLLEQIKRERDNAIAQAQQWKIEAQCHKSSLHETYQYVTGGTGEPGDWNGANPIIEALTARDNTALREGNGGGIFKLGDRVTKKSGSSWTGKVVGFYSTSFTPEGYAIESETETGSVQIYPVRALTRIDTALRTNDQTAPDVEEVYTQISEEPAPDGLVDEQRVAIQTAIYQVAQRYDFRINTDAVREIRQAVEPLFLSALTAKDKTAPDGLVGECDCGDSAVTGHGECKGCGAQVDSPLVAELRDPWKNNPTDTQRGAIPDWCLGLLHRAASALTARDNTALLNGIRELAIEAHDHWDADRDFKAGKIIMALAGRNPEYDERADALTTALAGDA